MTEPRIRVRRPDPPMPESEDSGPVLNVPTSYIPVLGVDASLTATGVANLYNQRLNTRTIAPKTKGVLRLHEFREAFTHELRRWHPELVVFEGYGYAGKFTHSHSLGELGGVLKLVALDRKIPFIVVPPTVLKLFVTGKGNTEKNAVSKEAYKRFGVDLTDNNQIDAAVLAIMGLARLYPDFPLTEFQRKALTKIAE
jgi:Holliday junction resolvasome RuvABC endonuclease subunit